MRNSHPVLRDLTDLEYEMCALVKYGPRAAESTYCVPNGDGTDWVRDENHPAALEYADDVIRRIK